MLCVIAESFSCFIVYVGWLLGIWNLCSGFGGGSAGGDCGSAKVNGSFAMKFG